MFREDLFKDKVALVTGGRSGIGFDIARRLLQTGAVVYIASRKEDQLEQAAKELSQWGEVHAVRCDIRKEEDVDALVTSIQENDHGLDILVNNAGGQFISNAEAITKNGWEAVINNNLNGTWQVTQKMAQNFFIPNESGVIVNIIIMISKGFPGMAHSAAARAGVDSLTKTLAVEWSRFNIRVNAIAPGFILSSGLKNYPPELVEKLAGIVPLKRLGTTEEVADLSLFLASPMAGFITGETVYIDGGQRLTGGMFELFENPE